MAQIHPWRHLHVGSDMLERAFSVLAYSQACAHLPRISSFLWKLRSEFQAKGWLLSSTFLAHEANPVFGYSMQGPLKSRRSARAWDLRSTQLQLGFPMGLISSPSGPFVWCFHACIVWSESSNTMFPKVWWKYESPGVLLKCRFCFRISEMRLQVLHFYQASKWCWHCGASLILLWVARVPLLQASSRTFSPKINPFSSSPVLWNLGAWSDNTWYWSWYLGSSLIPVWWTDASHV